MAKPRYQVFEDLPSWQFEALKASIERYGVLLPVVKDEMGHTIDGHQRERACRELGIKNYPVITLAGLTREGERDHALMLNMARRRLTRKQVRGLIEAELRRTPDIASNHLGVILGVSHNTVEVVRRRLIATCQIDKYESYRGRDGKARRVTRVVTHTAREAAVAQQALRVLGRDAPPRVIDHRLATRKAERKLRSARSAERALEPPGDASVRLFHSRFQELEGVAGIGPGSVNLILTDVPYGREFLPQLSDLAAFAERVLVQGGLFVTYYGHTHLDRAMEALGERLTYAWTAASVWEGVANEAFHRQVFSRWKPILIYAKGEWARSDWWYDVYKFNGKEKAAHDHQQPLPEVEKLVGDFSRPGDLVVDPCGGGFTTALACRNLGRRCVSCDVDLESVVMGQERLSESPARPRDA